MRGLLTRTSSKASSYDKPRVLMRYMINTLAERDTPVKVSIQVSKLWLAANSPCAQWTKTRPLFCKALSMNWWHVSNTRVMSSCGVSSRSRLRYENCAGYCLNLTHTLFRLGTQLMMCVTATIRLRCSMLATRTFVVSERGNVHRGLHAAQVELTFNDLAGLGTYCVSLQNKETRDLLILGHHCYCLHFVAHSFVYGYV